MPLIFLLEPLHQGRKVIDHRPRGKLLSDSLAEDDIPVTGSPQCENTAEKIANPLFTAIVAFARVLLQNLQRDAK